MAFPQRPMQPGQPDMAPPGAGAPPAPPTGPDSAAPPQGGDQPGGPSGPQRVANTGFNQQIQNILLSRIEEQGQKNPQFGQAIDKGVTPQAAQELALILPELVPVMQAIGLLPGAGGPQAPQQPQPAPGQPGAQPAAAPGAGPAAANDSGDGQDDGTDDGADEEDASDNPLLEKKNVSQGLIG